MERSPIEVFFSYSREDKPLRDKLEIHLSSLKGQGVISSWHDRQIVAGSEWEEEIDRHMRTADIILLLVSPDFVASQYCYDIELPDAMARHEAGEAYVVPVLLRPIAGWKNLSFAKLQVYPSGGVPVTRWGNEDDAFVDVAEGIAVAVNKLLEKRREAERLKAEQIRQEQEAQARREAQARLEKEQAQLRAEQAKQEQEEHTKREERARQEAQARQARQAQQEEQARLKAERIRREQEEQAQKKEQARQERQARLEEASKQAAILNSSRRRSGIHLFSLIPTYVITSINRRVLIKAGIAAALVLGGGTAIISLSNSQPLSNVFSVFASIFPRSADSFFNSGLDKQKKGDNEGAIADYDKAIKLKPNFAEAFNSRGNARSDLGDNQAAIDDYDQAIKLKPDYANAFYNRGYVRSVLGDKQAAIADSKKAADLYWEQGKPDDYQDALNRFKKLQQ